MGITQWWQKLTGKDRAGSGVRDRSSGPASPADGKRPTKGSGTPAAAQPQGRPGRRAKPREDLPVLGVDAAKGGWVGALLEAGGHGTPALFVAQSVQELLDQTGPVTVVAIDIPIGLPDSSRRQADVQTRELLGAKASSVFTTPVREAVYAATYGEANEVNRQRLGKGISQQAYGLRRRIMEVDAWLRQDLDLVVAEVHPEASFTELAGQPVMSRKRSAEGAQERRELLARAGVYVPGSAPHGVSPDDMIDACAAAWTAHRIKTGRARTVPAEPEKFSDGIPAAIHI